jgi:hypothetical protein
MLATQLALPQADGSTKRWTPSGTPAFSIAPAPPPRTRVAFAAAHVVVDPLAPDDPVAASRIDWDRTLAYRRHLWSLGFSVAEAMDTAQRGMGLSSAHARELIRRSAAEARIVGGGIASGAGTDDLAPAESHSLDAIERAYLEACAFVESCDSRVILMASRALAANARGPEDYARVYATVLGQVRRPVILHWLGEMFDPQLRGYWGSHDLDAATESALAIITANASKIDGIKISLLDAGRERALRARLPASVRMYTGDDFNYPELIAGDADGYSDALLGIFDAIAPAARAALAALDDADRARYDAILAPTVPLSRHMFSAPTYAYKTGVVFLAYLNGYQNHFRMLAGAESSRSVVHLARILELADAAGLILDVDRAADRMHRVLAVAGAA